MTTGRRWLEVITFLVGSVWMASSFQWIPISPGITHSCWTAFLILWGIRIVLDWRSRKDDPHPYKEPPPALSAVTVIIGTGAVAVLITARNADSASAYAFPSAIALVTVALAIIVYRFASKNRDRIGEARFDTKPHER